MGRGQRICVDTKKIPEVNNKTTEGKVYIINKYFWTNTKK